MFLPKKIIIKKNWIIRKKNVGLAHGFIVHGLGGPCTTHGFIVHGLGGPCTWF